MVNEHQILFIFLSWLSKKNTDNFLITFTLTHCMWTSRPLCLLMMSLAYFDCSHTSSCDDLFYWVCFAVCLKSEDDLTFRLLLFLSFLFFSVSLFCHLFSPPSFISHFFLLNFPSLISPTLFFCRNRPQLCPHHSNNYHLPPLSFSLHVPLLSVGGAFVLGTYTILFLKLYSYKDVNMWCRELSTAKTRKLARSLSCKLPAFMHWSALWGWGWM